MDIDQIKSFADISSLYNALSFIGEGNEFEFIKYFFRAYARTLVITWIKGEKQGILGQFVDEKYEFIAQTTKSAFMYDQIFESRIAFSNLEMIRVKVIGGKGNSKAAVDSETIES